jgi:hypothetical protein
MAEVTGIELRDWFAGQALKGILSSSPEGIPLSPLVTEQQLREIAKRSYELADAMMREHERSVRPVKLKRPAGAARSSSS